MTPERWLQLKQIFQSALERNPAERSAFLSQACAGDPALRSEVESLISSHDQAGDSIEAMAAEAATEMLANDRAIVGKQIGRYQVLSCIGRGGMGEVFLAQDASLGRKVALKLLRAEFTGDKDRLRRFRQEARAASALNHPNILTIYEIGSQDSTHVMATEYVEGETLRQHLGSARMKLGDALDVAIQVAGALAAAHEAGIVHRDIKPENIMVRRDGYAKVLDFGLAKLTERAPASSDSAWPTLGKVETNPGVVMGTVQYMSPEQARGLEVDARTDIFSLGVVLYETVAGRAPFVGETPSDVIVSLLDKEPVPLSSYLPEVPTELQRIVDKSLRKETEERYQTSKELFVDLQRLRQKFEIESHLERSAPPEASGGATRANVAVRLTTKRTGQLRRFLSARRTILSAAVLTILILGALAYVWRWRQTSVAPQAGIKSLAVLPLRSLNNTGDNYMGLGIADAVIRRISQTGELTVRPTSAVRKYINEEVDSLEVARQLNVDAVFEGTVQRDGDRLRVGVNLLRTSNGELLWADSFDMRSTDIFTIQDEVAQQVAARLRLRLNPTQQMRLAKRYTSNTAAYEYYVKGMYSLDQRGWYIEDKPQMEATIALFKQAISADPQYALAHAQLAYAYAWMAMSIEQNPVWVEYARQEIRQAEALDSQLAETHVARHLILWSAYEGFQTEAAIRELLLAQQLNPGIGHLELGVLYWHIGLEDHASRELQMALEIDPTSEPVKAEIYNFASLGGKPDEALAAQQRFFNRGPGLRYYLEKNRLNDAQPLLEQALAKEPTNPEVRLRKALFLALKEDFHAAEAEIPWILEHIRKDRGYHHNTYEIARVYALAGKRQAAIKWLRETAATGLPCYPLFERDPYLNRIRQAPEFIQFMSEMKAQVEKYKREFV
ncbi:MAG: protein kinase domain-containing protein [Pyrinomonadaceae bacterium]